MTMATILYLGTAGSNDPTRAAFPFQWALGARDAGHDAEVFVAGEAVYLMKSTVADAVLPVAMPPVKELVDEVIATRIPIFV
jgi:predicted peroxiredoxin